MTRFMRTRGWTDMLILAAIVGAGYLLYLAAEGMGWWPW